MNINQIKNLDRNDFLNMLGVETRRPTMDYVVPALAVFGFGVVVGAGVGLLVAPRPGRELREDLSRSLHRAPDAIAQLPQRATDAIHRVAGKLDNKALA